MEAITMKNKARIKVICCLLAATIAISSFFSHISQATEDGYSEELRANVESGFEGQRGLEGSGNLMDNSEGETISGQGWIQDNEGVNAVSFFTEGELAGESLADGEFAGERLAEEELAGESLAGEGFAGERLADEELAGESLADVGFAGMRLADEEFIAEWEGLEGIRVNNAAELRRVFTHGAATGGDANWSGERLVYVAFEDLGSSISTTAPPGGTERVVILRSADGVRRDLVTNTGNTATHFQIGNRNRLILDDENLHIVGHNFDEKVAGTVGGGLRIDNGGTFELRRGTIRHIASFLLDSPIVVRSGGTFLMKGGYVRNNRANTGGAFWVNGGHLEMFGGAICDNYTVTYGGGLNLTGGASFNMYGGAIHSNTADGQGGGLMLNLLSTFNMYGGEIWGNTAAGEGGGGGLRVDGASLFNMFDGLIDGNEVISEGRFPYGGGVAVFGDSTFNMNGGVISNNTSHRGGGVAAWEGIFNLGTGRTTSGRAPAGQGGAVGNPIIIGNTAKGGGSEHTSPIIGYGGGGGVFVYGKGGLNGNANFIMHSGVITENTTAHRGGGVFVNAAEFHMRGGEISNNSTTNNESEMTGGGGIYLHDNSWLLTPANFTMTGGVIRDNFSRNGGGIARNNEVLPIRISGNSIISGNTAQRLGGGIFTHTPAPENSAINFLSVAQNRGNFTTASTVRFEKNRSLLPVSRGLTVLQVKTNSPTVYQNVQWMGKNSISGVYNDDTSFHLFNNHDVSNLQGTVITEESFDFHHIIEKYVDIFGKPIEEMRDNKIAFERGDVYTSNPPIIEGYVVVGYKWDLPPNESGEDFELGSPKGVQVNSSKTIYLVYKEKGTGVSISKTVSGKFANMTQSFDFTIYFMDSDKKPMASGREFEYKGGVISDSKVTAPKDGVFKLDADGKVTFTLSHGQKISIENLPSDAFIRIVEKNEVDYIESFVDSAEAEKERGNDTGIRLVGREDRAFDFLNTRYEVVATGIKEGMKGLELPMYITTGAILLGVTTEEIIRRCFRFKNWRKK